jgi:hypothetical protein
MAEKKEKGSIEVAGKSFSFTDGESELEAYMKARRYLRQLHDDAVARTKTGGGVVLTPPPANLRKAGN